MGVTRRQFMGVSAGAGLAGCMTILGGSVHGANDTVTFAAINDLHLLDDASVAIVNRAVEQR